MFCRVPWGPDGGFWIEIPCLGPLGIAGSFWLTWETPGPFWASILLESSGWSESSPGGTPGRRDMETVSPWRVSMQNFDLSDVFFSITQRFEMIIMTWWSFGPRSFVFFSMYMEIISMGHKDIWTYHIDSCWTYLRGSSGITTSLELWDHLLDPGMYKLHQTCDFFLGDWGLGAPSHLGWLVVWDNFFYFPIYWECHHPNWRTLIFFRGVETTNQIIIS